MEYRKMPHGGAKVSVIGMGSSVVGEQKEEDIIRTVQYALDAGINYFDMAGGHASIFSAYGKDMQILDMLMFSINPMYDFGQGDFAIGATSERLDLYRRCEKEGVGISVMKPFNAGQLLDAAKSPFHQALTTAQCIQYALDKPGVLTVVGGPGNISQLKEILSYLDTTEEERDYSVIGSFTPDDSVGKCVYCRHCHPCPAGLDIALIIKYYDLSRQGDVLAKEHYLTLSKTATDCIGCGHCNKRCPFKVHQQERMAEIKEYFHR